MDELDTTQKERKRRVGHKHNNMGAEREKTS